MPVIKWYAHVVFMVYQVSGVFGAVQARLLSRQKYMLLHYTLMKQRVHSRNRGLILRLCPELGCMYLL